MTVRGGGIPRRPLALTPNGRMGPPLRSFAADAHDCIMVRVLGPTGYKVVARLNRAPKAGSPLIVIATALSVPSCSKPSRYGLARAKHAARLVRRPILTASARIDLSDARVGMKKRTLRSNQETDEGKRCAALANSLTKKAPYKGLGAESEEKREPASDIDPGVVDGLKVLDPDGRLEKRLYLVAKIAHVHRIHLCRNLEAHAQALRDGDRPIRTLFGRDATEEGKGRIAGHLVERVNAFSEAMVNSSQPVRDTAR